MTECQNDKVYDQCQQKLIFKGKLMSVSDQQIIKEGGILPGKDEKNGYSLRKTPRKTCHLSMYVEEKPSPEVLVKKKDKISTKKKKKIKINPLQPLKRKRDKELAKLTKVHNFLKKRKEKVKSKTTFSVQELVKARARKNEILESLQTLTDEYGELIKKYPEPTFSSTTWEYVLKELPDVHENFIQFRHFRQTRLKKLAKGCIYSSQKREQLLQSQKEQEITKKQDLMKSICKAVHREYWQNCLKIYRFYVEKKEALKEKEVKQKKLEELIDRQLKLSNQLAEYLVHDNKEKDLNSNIDSGASINSNEYNDVQIIKDNSNKKKQLLWNLSINSKNQYQFINYTHEVEEEPQHPLTHLHGSLPHFVNYLNEIRVYPGHPFLIRNKLRSYQLNGLQWLLTLHQKNINGILADEMGLGKTIQTIAFLAELAGGQGIWGPHLIIVPTSLILNWENELKRWCPSLKVMTYFGKSDERRLKRKGWTHPNSFNVCITSYRITLIDQNIFKRKRWYYIILDEAQHIKNFKTQTWKIISSFFSERRLMLTGTPLQNDVGELWSLMNFLMPDRFESFNDFREWFSQPVQKALQKNVTVSKKIISNLQDVLRPLILRRLKRDVEKQLPKKKELVIKCALSRKQKFLYDEFINSQIVAYGHQTDDFVGVMNTLMQLRKVCNHPYLFEGAKVRVPFLTTIICLHYHRRCWLNIDQKSEKILDLCNIIQCFDNEFYFFDELIRQHPSIYVLKTKIVEIEESIKNIDKEHFSGKIKLMKLLELQTKILRNHRLSMYKIITKRSAPYNSSLIQKCIIQSKLFYTDKTVVDNFLSSHIILDEFVVKASKAIAMKPQLVLSSYSTQYNIQEETLSAMLMPYLFNITHISHNFYVRSIMELPNKKDLVFDSGKLNAMINLLSELKRQGHKCLIFTQMARMLDIIEAALSMHKFTYVRLDGATRTEMRQLVVDKFNYDNKIFCFISSTRSGGIGINLTAADTVIFYDTDWNPSHDLQAQDRCHRIGQTRNVTIYRLISEFTIEENILLKSLQKRQLDQFIMEEGNFNIDFFKKLNVRDIIGDSFGFKTNEKVADINYLKFAQALKDVEDKDDYVMGAQAMEEVANGQLGENADNDENEQQMINIEDEDDLNPDEMIDDLPSLWKYGIQQMSDGSMIGELERDVEMEVDAQANGNVADGCENKDIIENNMEDEKMSNNGDDISDIEEKQQSAINALISKIELKPREVNIRTLAENYFSFKNQYYAF